MIVVDTSAVLAILFDEPERSRFEHRLAAEKRLMMSSVNVHEAATVLRIRQGIAGVERLWRFLDIHSIEVASFDRAQVLAASVAFDDFGKGLDPKARLNLCDCAAYALAKTMAAPLLFKGDDFVHTDLTSAV